MLILFTFHQGGGGYFIDECVTLPELVHNDPQPPPSVTFAKRDDSLQPSGFVGPTS